MESRTKQGFPGALPFFGNNREQEDARERHGRDEETRVRRARKRGQNPAQCSVPSQKRMTPEIIMVRCPSRMAGHARLKPICTASRGVLPERNSSLVRSNISTFASTAMPTEMMSPAIPEAVSVTGITLMTASMNARAFGRSASALMRPGRRYHARS